MSWDALPLSETQVGWDLSRARASEAAGEEVLGLPGACPALRWGPGSCHRLGSPLSRSGANTTVHELIPETSTGQTQTPSLPIVSIIGHVTNEYILLNM